MIKIKTLKKYKKENIKHLTKTEGILYRILKKKVYEWGCGKLKRQFIIKPYIVDFFISNYGVIIEVDGGYHKNRIEYDSKRDTYLENLGTIILHFDNETIEKNIEQVIETIKLATNKRGNFSFKSISNNNDIRKE